MVKESLEICFPVWSTRKTIIVVSKKWEYLKVHRVIGGKQLLPVNFATVRREKTEKITAKDRKTDKDW